LRRPLERSKIKTLLSWETSKLLPQKY